MPADGIDGKKVAVVDGDMLIYKHSDATAAQAWLREGSQWVAVQDGHRRTVSGHDYLFEFGNQLSAKWVTPATIERRLRAQRMSDRH